MRGNVLVGKNLDGELFPHGISMASKIVTPKPKVAFGVRRHTHIM